MARHALEDANLRLEEFHVLVRLLQYSSHVHLLVPRKQLLQAPNLVADPLVSLPRQYALRYRGSL
ncbi:hypothetical protein U1Q18_001375, partial [Sarracenia purpurea var. burkii]